MEKELTLYQLGNLLKAVTENYEVSLMSKIKLSGGVLNMKRTFQPNTRRRSKKMGFFARMKAGIVNRRRNKGRKVLSH